MLTTRETVVEHLLNNNTSELDQLINRDPFARHVFQEEKLNFMIEGYLDNELSDPDRSAVEYLLHTNPEFRKEFVLRRKLNDSDKNLPLLIALDKACQTYHQERWQIPDEGEKTESAGIGHKFIHWVAAASILFIIGVSMLFALNTPRPGPAELYAEYYSPLNQDQRSRLVVNSSALSQAKQNYLNEDYLAAFSILKNLPDTVSIHTEKQFYLALSMLELGMYDDAIASFKVVLQNQYTECVPQAHWYLALCYLKTGSEDLAKQTLQTISANKSYNYLKAEKILRKL